MTRLAAALIVYAGLAGAAGVALAAMAAHGADTAMLATPAQFLIMHAAAAATAVTLAGRASRACFFLAAAAVLLAGATLFSGAVAMRVLSGSPPFPMAAPIGGTVMIVGWLLLAAAGVWELAVRRG
jgi:uncharacterized membrane protein YgdD (TMEM256/DUF423 family)